MQKAWYYEQYGSVEVLQEGWKSIPVPKHNQLLIQVRAAALNPIDSKVRERPHFPACFPVIPGCDMAGVVVLKGLGVSKFEIGDQVYGNVHDFNHAMKFGTLAEFIAVDEHLVALKPRRLSFEEAASLPVAVQTAYEGLNVAGVQGRTVFVVGGAGGVGSMAVQLAKHVFKASEVVATTSTTKVNLVKNLGADKVVDYTKTRYEEIWEKYDLVFDTVGDSKNSYVVAKRFAPIIDITWPPANPRAIHISLKVSGGVLQMLNPFFESGIVKAVIDPASPYHFSNVRQAYEYLETGRARGKVVISSFPSQPMSFSL